MGSFIAQELALMSPNRVDSLILAASVCGGNEGLLASSRVKQAVDTMTDTSSPTQEEMDRVTSTFFPEDWFKTNPNYQEYIALVKKPVSPEIVQMQIDVIGVYI